MTSLSQEPPSSPKAISANPRPHLTTNPCRRKDQQPIPRLRARNWARIMLPCLALMATAAASMHLRHHYGRYVVDDAFISFRYGKNFVRGIGLVYNPGDYTKGYSNTLWTLLSIIPEWTGVDPLKFAQILGGTVYLSLFAVSYFLFRHPKGGPTATGALYIPALLASFAPLAAWHVAGLETGVYAGLLFGGLAARVHEQQSGGNRISTTLFSLAVLSRPEGIMFFLAMGLHDAIYRTAKRRWKKGDMLFYLIPPACYGLELMASKLYYGQYFPQTFYAKVSGAPGVWEHASAVVTGLVEQSEPKSYLRRGLDSTGLGELAALLGTCALFSRSRQRLSLAAALFVTVQVIFIARAKSDWMPMFRFGVPLLPFIAILIGEGIACVTAVAGRSQYLLGVVSLVAVLIRVIPANQEVAVSKRVMSAGKQLQLGRQWRTLGPPGLSLASFDIGGQGYAGDFTIVDTGGLVQPELARCTPYSQACGRFVQLASPTVLRPHLGNYDKFIMNYVARPGHYLKLNGRQRRDPQLYVAPRLLFAPKLPNTATQIMSSNLHFAPRGIEIPSHVRPGAEMRATLYWQQNSPKPIRGWSRRFAWHRHGERISVKATPPTFDLLRQRKAWTKDNLLIDHVIVRAPEKPGSYELWTRAGDMKHPIYLAKLIVPNLHDIQSLARRLSAVAQTLAGEDQLCKAVPIARTAHQLLQHPDTRDTHHQLAIRLSAKSTENAENPRKKLRSLQSAYTLLMQALSVGKASPALRNAIDSNSTQRRKLIADLLNSN